MRSNNRTGRNDSVRSAEWRDHRKTPNGHNRTFNGDGFGVTFFGDDELEMAIDGALRLIHVGTGVQN